MSGLNLKLDKYCQIPFGAYVQVAKDNNTTNTKSLQSINGIYLETLDKKQGGYWYMNLWTGQVITCHNVKEIPVTDLVIKYSEEIPAEQGINT